MLLIAFLCALSSPSHAHRPHTVVTAMTGTNEPEVAWALLDPHDISQIMVTRDAGAHWDHVDSPAMEQTLVGIAVDGDNTLYTISGDGTLWISPDSSTWNHTNLFSGEAVARDIKGLPIGAVVATSKGVIVSDNVGSTYTLSPSFLDVTGINVTCGGDCSVTAVGTEGGVWHSEGLLEDLQPLATLPGGRKAFSVVSSGEHLWVGTQAGALHQDITLGTWETCGLLPNEITGAHEDLVSELAITPDGSLLAATGHEALFVSEDNCQTWTRKHTGLEIPFGGTGNATDPNTSWVYLHLSDNKGLVGGFSGAAFSDNNGDTWRESAILRNRYTRALAVTEGPSGSLRIYSAGYGGGATWTDDGGETWAGSAVGLDSETVSYDLLVASEEPEIVLMTGLSALYRSSDSGERWESVEVPMARARALHELDQALYLLGETPASDGNESHLARSTDLGESWSTIESFTNAADGAMANTIRQGTLKGESVLAVTTDVPAGVLASQDGGLSWASWLEAESEPSSGLEFWPPGESGRLVFASPSTGILLGTSAEEDWWSPRSPPVGEPRRLAMADDGTLLVATRGGSVWQSDDGGETWVAMGNGPPCAIFDLVPIPGFAEHPLVLLGTQLGVWWSDGGDFLPAPWLERLENGGVFLSCGEEDEYCPTYTNPNEGAGGGLDLGGGGLVRFSTEGEKFRLLAGGGGEWEAIVNGTPLSPTGGEIALPGAGWKDVEIVVHAGELLLDAIEVGGSGTAIPLPASQEDTSSDTARQPNSKEAPQTGCGACATTQPPKHGAWLLLAPIAWLAIRRNQSKTR
ncbi:MAG: hypothetical protein VX519_07420 [Myxococcota bacterium]|nr:hypothetical protein [Myxococcota bacterium]